MTRLKTLIASLVLMTLPLASCDTSGTASPLPNSGSDLPQDDGRVFEPSRPPVEPPVDTDENDDGPGNNNKTSGGDKNVSDGLDAKDPGKNGGGKGPNSPVPEPTTLLVFGTGIAGVAVLRRRRKLHDVVEDES